MEHDENPFDFSTLRYITDKESSRFKPEKRALYYHFGIRNGRGRACKTPYCKFYSKF
jgi:hypothetical protein